MSTIYHDLQLSKLRVPLPRKLAYGPFSRDIRNMNPNVAAWSEDADLLEKAYSEMSDAAAAYRTINPFTGEHSAVWTIEPCNSPLFVHTAIVRAGLVTVHTPARYDDQESRTKVPGISQLYVTDL